MYCNDDILYCNDDILIVHNDRSRENAIVLFFLQHVIESSEWMTQYTECIINLEIGDEFHCIMDCSFSFF